MNLHPGRVAALFAACLILAAARPALAVDGTPTWIFNPAGTVAADRLITTPDLQYDHLGRPAVAWSSIALGAGGNVVRHSQLSGLGLWNHRDVATGTGVGLRTALTFDPAERPTIAWTSTSGAVHAQFNGGTTQTVAASGAALSFSFVDLHHDLAGNLRGAFRTDQPGQFASISFNGAGFSSATLATIPAPDDVVDAAFVTDHTGLRHLAMRTASDLMGLEAIVIASEPQFGGPWASTTFLTADAVGGVDLAIDPTDGRLAMAYTVENAGSHDLVYAKFNGVALEPETILSTANGLLGDLSLAFDLADGRPAIAYEFRSATFDEELHFAYLGAGRQWNTMMIDDEIIMDDPTGRVRKPSLAFDDFGTSYPSVAYIDADPDTGNERLMVAIDPPVPEPASAWLLIAGTWLLRRRRRT